MLRPRLPRWVLLGAIWLLPGLYFAVQVYLQHSSEDRPLSITHALTQGLVFWFLWAITSPLILKLTRMFPFRTEQWSDALLLHLPAGTIISLAHLLVFVFTISWINGNTIHSFDELLARFQPVFLSSFAWWSLVYWTFLVASYAFHFYERFQEGLLRASQLEAQLAQAELQALKMQLHPHFLFNTLHSISALMHEDVEAADKMVARLGEFLRMTLRNSGAFEITLEEEVKFLECYLDIERIRFEERLAVEFDIEPALLDARVPNLILQPIVENAIRHGIAPQTGPGKLAIRAHRRDGSLLLEVEDNGPGMNEAAGSSVDHWGGLGLLNTRGRLERYYGSPDRLRLENGRHGGLRVTLQIPLQYGEKGDHE
jgi:two-component system, LytTR family, sensor kinase